MRALRLMGLLAAALAAGCGNDTSAGGGPPKQPPQISFGPTDLATGVGTVWVSITGPDDVTTDVVSSIAPHIRVAGFPGDDVVPATQSTAITSRQVSPNLVQVPAFAQIQEQLDASLDGGQWYAISLPANPSQYVDQVEFWLFPFDDGSHGVRVSPSHPPIVASVMSCPKDAGVVGVYARYSESVTKAAGAPSLDYGTAPASCSMSMDAPGETQFVCAGELGQPFSLRLPDGISAQVSGRPMAAGMLDSSRMQSFVGPYGCTIYRPMIVN